MDKTSKSKNIDASLIAKAGLWFTVCNFVFKGLAFITIPIFTRLLTKKELGDFSNYSTIIIVMSVLTSLDLSSSIIRSKVEHEDDIDSYIWSILSFSTIFTILIYIYCIINMKSAEFFFGLESKYIHLMFMYCLFSPAYSMLITKHRAFYRYKSFVFITAIVAISSTILSLILVYNMDDKLWGRSLGQYSPSIFVGIIIYFSLVANGKKIKLSYWKYALVICVPLVPHVLSAVLLSASDKIIITRISGSQVTAIYSIASNCYNIVVVLMNSMNTARTPWLFENLKLKNYNEISKISKKYIIFFSICALGIMLIGPELILFFGGRKYIDAIYCINPLICSCVIQFIYLFYVNVEFYTKKTIGVSIATAISALLNIFLNIVFINKFKSFGYLVASYTTLVGYIVLLILHYFITKILNMNHIYNNAFFFKLTVGFIIISLLMNILYKFNSIRYITIFIYIWIFIKYLYKNRDEIIAIFKKR